MRKINTLGNQAHKVYKRVKMNKKKESNSKGIVPYFNSNFTHLEVEVIKMNGKHLKGKNQNQIKIKYLKMIFRSFLH